MEQRKCLDYKIPSHLHNNNHPVIESFPNKTKVYRRFNIAKIDDCYKLDLPKESKERPIVEMFSDLKNMSCYHNNYNEFVLNDVLYNDKNGEHYEDEGIIELDIINIENTSFKIDGQKEDVSYRLKVTHKPEDCLHHHCEILAYETKEGDEILIDEIKAKSIKAKIRLHFSLNCEIVLKPKKCRES